MIVSRPVYESGVKALSKEQLKAIYESKVKNWKEVGGFDRPIVFFNKEPGRGTWEVFAEFLYGRASLAPKVFHPEVGANQEARSKVGAHVSAISQLSAAWAEGRLEVRPLAILNDGKAIEPTLGNIKTGTYPLRRPLVLLTNGEPKGAIGKFIDYLRSPPGQQIVKKYGYVPLQ